MRRENDNLIFDQDECSDLLSVYARYLDSAEAERHDEAVKDRMEFNRQLVGELALMRMTRGLRQDLDETTQNELAYMILVQTTDDRLPYVTKDMTEVELDNSDGRVREVLEWAAKNLQPGTTAIQNVVGKALNSAHEDHPVSEALGSTNEKMANYMAKSNLAAGRAAAKWLLQLEPKK